MKAVMPMALNPRMTSAVTPRRGVLKVRDCVGRPGVERPEIEPHGPVLRWTT